MGNFSDLLKTAGISYSWASQGIYKIRMIDQDEYGGESEWSNPFIVSMSRCRKKNPLICRFFENDFSLLSFLRNICDV